MLIKYFIFIFIVIPVLAQGYNLENATFSNIEVSGFIDFISSYSNSSADKTYISLEHPELDFAKDLNLTSSFKIAIVHNTDISFLTENLKLLKKPALIRSQKVTR